MDRNPEILTTENTQNNKLGYVLDVGKLRELLNDMPDNLKVGTGEDGKISFYDDEDEDEDNYDGPTHVIKTFIPLIIFKGTYPGLGPLQHLKLALQHPTANDFLEF